MNHQDFSAALKEALAEAKRKFESIHTVEQRRKDRNVRYEIKPDGVRVRWQQWTPYYKHQIEFDGKPIEVWLGAYWSAANTTYTWEELLK